MEFLRLLENIRIPVLNELMLAVTYLGDEIAFLVAVLIVFWCVDKRKSYYLLGIGMLGTTLNQFMKLWFRVPRPWVLDENFTILEQAREGAGGYSFPSGHSQSSVGTFGGIAAVTKNKALRILCIVICVLVPFSRMYLGVHTPADVLAGSAMAVALIFVLRPLIFARDGKYIPAALLFMTAVSVGYVCFVSFYPFPADVDQQNLLSGTKNAYTLLGALLGFLVAYFVDEKWLRFPVKAVWWAQIIKVVVGLGLVLAVKEGLSSPLKNLLGEYPGRMVRYFLIVIVAGIVWPLSFKWFSKLGKNENNGGICDAAN